MNPKLKVEQWESKIIRIWIHFYTLTWQETDTFKLLPSYYLVHQIILVLKYTWIFCFISHWACLKSAWAALPLQYHSYTLISLVNSLTFLHSCNVQKLFINLLFWCRLLLLPYSGQGSLGCLCSQGSQNREQKYGP